MDVSNSYQFSGRIAVFQDRRLPEVGVPAGYAALIDALDLAVPLPRTLYATGTRHKVVKAAGWHLLTPRHAPEASLEGHLTFALKYEGLNLLVLKKLFEATGPEPLETIVKSTPTGSYARRICFLYEWLMGDRLDLPDADQGAYVLVIDPRQQMAGTPVTSPRHRVKNNLPGSPAFCPLVHRTDELDAWIGRNLPARAREVVADVPRGILARTAAFLLLKDSKSDEGSSLDNTALENACGSASDELEDRGVGADRNWCRQCLTLYSQDLTPCPFECPPRICA